MVHKKNIAETHSTSEGEILVPLNSVCYLVFTSAEARTELRWLRKKIFSNHSLTQAVASRTVYPAYTVSLHLATATLEETFKWSMWQSGEPYLHFSLLLIYVGHV